MTWPTPQDYNEAVQNPHSNFADSELRVGNLAVSRLGLPLVASGAFASVYKMSCSGKNFAVRCFLKEIPNQHVRYERISKYVMGDNLPYTVEFNYLNKGVFVRGRWYPLLKMDWVNGTTLDNYVKSNLSRPHHLAQITEKFKAMMLDLKDAGIAHGDLQHGNVLVTEDGELRLVDYDGMYVPELSGFQSNELGHRNYQHPDRHSVDFGARIDNFSAWSIYVSLLSLSRDPELSAQPGACDESLLFRHDDYRYPLVSPAFSILEGHKDETIRQHARILRSLLSLTVDSVPYLSDSVVAPNSLPALQPVSTPIQSGGYSRNSASTRSTTSAAQDTTFLWPSLPEYIKSVSNPARNFIDPRMQQYVLVRERDHSIHAQGTEHGALFRFRQEHGGDVLVKVFLKGDELIDKRYELLRSLIHRDGETLSILGRHFVDFTLIPKGLKVEQNYYSIVKMENLKFKTVFEEVEQNRTDKHLMKVLIHRFCLLMDVLEKFQIVHGDIEPGNILVGPDHLVLVDYDLATTPLSRPLASSMLGIRHMQHPKARVGGPHVNDHFSAWILYYSLKLLMLYPNFWNIAGAKPGRLIFHADDFKHPNDSQLMIRLKSHFNEEVRRIAAAVEELCSMPPDAIPPLRHGLVTELFQHLVPMPAPTKKSSSLRSVSQVNRERLFAGIIALSVVTGVVIGGSFGLALVAGLTVFAIIIVLLLDRYPSSP